MMASVNLLLYKVKNSRQHSFSSSIFKSMDYATAQYQYDASECDFEKGHDQVEKGHDQVEKGHDQVEKGHDQVSFASGSDMAEEVAGEDLDEVLEPEGIIKELFMEDMEETEMKEEEMEEGVSN